MAENGTTIGKAYVQIMPSTEGMKANLTQAMGGEAESAGASAGNSFASRFKSTLIKAGIAAAFTKVLKSALSEGAALQQSYLGGVDTLYGDAADSVRTFAKEASKFGISMNDYSEQAVSFGASLKQAYGGDAVKAAEAANTAIEDMADNQAKMGTDLSMIQDAYQGFAKQNYTMLDNLKLGYGGTKTEMERLLADAEELSGVEYDISNLGDVYEAIHVIQGDLNLTGVAANEASTTFSGSFNAMKASASNFLGSLALGTDVQPALDDLLTSVDTFFKGNFLPLLGTVGQSLIDKIPEMINGAASLVSGIVIYFAEHREEMVNAGGELIDGILEGITGKDSEIGSTISTALNNAITKLREVLRDLSVWWNNLNPGMQNFIIKAAEIAVIAVPLISVFSKIASTVSPLVSGIGGLIGKLTGFRATASASIPGTSGLSSALAMLTKNAVGLVAVGAGILMTAAGIALLADAAIRITDAGPEAALALVALGVAAAGMAAGASVLAPALTAGAVGLVAFGAGVALVGAGILAATAGIAMMSLQLPIIVKYGSSAANSITALGISLTGFAVGAVSAAVSLVALDVAFAGFAVSVAASAIGVAALDIAAAALALEMLTISESSQKASDNMKVMVDSVDIVETGLSSLGGSIKNALNSFVSAFTDSSPSLQISAQTFADAFATTMNTSFMNLNQTATESLISISTTTLLKMNSIYMSISSTMTRISAKVRTSIADMESAFSNARFEFNQSIKLPHFRMNGIFDAQSGSVPTVGVDWYSKGGILTKATIFGMNGSNLTAAGESGPEAVLPISKLRTYIDEALDEHETENMGEFKQNIYISSPKALTASEIARQTRNATKQMILSMKGV